MVFIFIIFIVIIFQNKYMQLNLKYNNFFLNFPHLLGLNY